MDAAVDQFRSGASTFQQQLEALIASVTAERTHLAASSEKLRLEREAYEQEKHRVSQVQLYIGQGASAPPSLQRVAPYMSAGLFRQRTSGSQCRWRQVHDYPTHTAKCSSTFLVCRNV